VFRKNEGPVDRAIRLVVAAVLIPVGLFALNGLDGSAVGIVATVIGGFALFTAATGLCLVYIPFGISTLPKDRGPATRFEVHSDVRFAGRSRQDAFR
jgi:Inner membrane protein YgaP-like, transmembrane domain